MSTALTVIAGHRAEGGDAMTAPLPATMFDPVKLLLDALRQQRAALSIQIADLKERMADIDQTIRRAEHLLARRQSERRNAA
jgi:hypothetical protein